VEFLKRQGAYVVYEEESDTERPRVPDWLRQTLGLDCFQSVVGVELHRIDDSGLAHLRGLTDTSLLPQAAEAAGISFEDLVGRILALAREPAAA
jgi:hypothetical protein